MATIPVNPGDSIVAKAAAASAGDTLVIAPGAYPQPSGQVSWPVDRHYLFAAGAKLTGVANGKAAIKFSGGTNTEFAGADVQNVQIVLSTTSGFNCHDNTFHDSVGYGGQGMIFAVGNSNGHMDWNTWQTISGFCVECYPATNNTFNNNRLDTITEGFHVLNGNGSTLSGNVITNLGRHGIECQGGSTNLTISGNYIGGWQGTNSGMCISAPCGSTQGHPPWAGAGEHIHITNNVLFGNAIGQGVGVEIGGDLDIHIDNNQILAMMGPFPVYGILNGTGGAKGEGLNSSGNLIQASVPYGDGDSAPWTVPPRNSNDNTTGPFPPVPPVPTTAGARNGNTPIPPDPPIPPVDIHMTATSTTTSITLSFDPLAGVTALTRRSKNGTDKPITLATLSGDSIGYTDTAIQPQWEYIYVLGSQTITAQGQQSTYTPVTPTPPSSSSSGSSSGGSSSGKPWLQIGHSVDGGKTWITDAYIPPHG